MGQINCQCQEVVLEHQVTESGNNKNQYVITFSPQLEDQGRDALIVLKNCQNRINVRVKQKQQVSLGTTNSSKLKYYSPFDSPFEIFFKLKEKILIVKDSCQGMGSFLLKNKIYIKKGLQTFMSVDQYFIVFNLTHQKLFWKVFHLFGEQSSSSQLQRDICISIGNIQLILRRQKGGEEYSIRRQDRKGIFLLLIQEQRVKINDVLRLGCEFFTIQSIDLPSQEVCRESKGKITSFKW